MLNLCILCGVTVVTLATRLYKLNEPDYVTWDEVHFGKMAGFYLTQTFFFDVHPPLGKLMIALSGYLSGYDGAFSFTNPGDSYRNDNGTLLVPYTTMRSHSAVIGSFVVSLCFVITLTISGRLSAALLASAFLVFDTGLITLSQYILLDPLLLFFIFLSICCTVKMSACQGKLALLDNGDKNDGSFTATWWFWLISSGVSLGCTISVKLVGLFSVGFIGLWTVADLWKMLGRVEMVPMLLFIKHLIARVIGLIFTPIAVYIAIFYIHLHVACHTGKAEVFYSTPFQASLKNHPLHNTTIPMYVRPNSTIALRAKHYDMEFLHSHPFNYPDSTFQQVTGYAHREESNNWIIRSLKNADSRHLRNGDIVQLIHAGTSQLLVLGSTKDEQWLRAMKKKRHFMVCATGPSNQLQPGAGEWRVETQETEQFPAKLRALESRVKLVNVAAGCCLHLSDHTLPAWGANHKEITCTREKKSQDRCIWTIETTGFDENEPRIELGMEFIGKLIESHQVMLYMNNKLKSVRGERTSKPWHWPINYKGQLFSKKEDGIILLGTPFIWHLNLIMVPVFAFLYLTTYILQKRGYTIEISKSKHSSRDFSRTINRTFDSCLWCLIAWLIHYAPFFLMNRVLFLHHYFPAHIFLCLFSGILVDFLCTVLSLVLSQHCRITKDGIKGSLYCVIFALLAHSFFTHKKYLYGR